MRGERLKWGRERGASESSAGGMGLVITITNKPSLLVIVIKSITITNCN